jgi:hypothetical protein
MQNQDREEFVYAVLRGHFCDQFWLATIKSVIGSLSNEQLDNLLQRFNDMKATADDDQRLFAKFSEATLRTYRNLDRVTSLFNLVVQYLDDPQKRAGFSDLIESALIDSVTENRLTSQERSELRRRVRDLPESAARDSFLALI